MLLKTMKTPTVSSSKRVDPRGPLKSNNAKRVDPRGPHQENVTPSYTASEFYHQMVHTPVDIKIAKGIPAAKDAVDKEWGKFWKKKAWLVETVEEKHIIQERARKQKKTVHFGSLRPLCFL